MNFTLDLLKTVAADGTWLLVCDLCDNRTRLPMKHPDMPRYLYEWKLCHEVHHVLLDGAAFDDPPITDPYGATPAPCSDEWDGATA